MLTKAQAELLDMLAAGAIYGAEQIGNMEAAERLRELRKEASLAEEQSYLAGWVEGRAAAYEELAKDLRRWHASVPVEDTQI